MDYLEFVLRRTLIKYKKAWSELEKKRIDTFSYIDKGEACHFKVARSLSILLDNSQ